MSNGSPSAAEARWGAVVAASIEWKEADVRAAAAAAEWKAVEGAAAASSSSCAEWKAARVPPPPPPAGNGDARLVLWRMP